MQRRKGRRKWLRWLAFLLMLCIAGIALKAWRDTTADPVIAHTQISLDLPDGSTAPRRIVFLSDIHVAGPDMPPARLARIVNQINALEPDAVFIAGDFVSDKRTATHLYPTEEAIAPLAQLSSRAIKLAVPGNHDHWRDIAAIRRELDRHGIGVLANSSIDLGGLFVAGLDDDFTGRADLNKTMKSMSPSPRHFLLLSHSPDPFPDLPPDSAIMLAGHTHCGQIAWPWGAAPATMSRYGQRYACGIVQERGNMLITTAGLGTSVLPFRLFTQPEIWVIDVAASEKPLNQPVKR